LPGRFSASLPFPLQAASLSWTSDRKSSVDSELGVPLILQASSQRAMGGEDRPRAGQQVPLPGHFRYVPYRLISFTFSRRPRIYSYHVSQHGLSRRQPSGVVTG
jgi:hypothetical protein